MTETKKIEVKSSVTLADIYKNLSAVDVSNHIEKVEQDDGRVASYLSWAWAYDYMMRFDAEFKFGFKKFTAEGIPEDFGDEEIAKRAYLEYQKLPDNMGYQIVAWAVVKGYRKEIALPVMGYKSRPIFENSVDKNGNRVFCSTSLNKNKMRALTKVLALFGLGIGLWQGEDIPTEKVEFTEKGEVVKKVIPLDEALKHAFVCMGEKKNGSTIQETVDVSEKNCTMLKSVLDSQKNNKGFSDGIYIETVLKAIEEGTYVPKWKNKPSKEEVKEGD